ncbi:electron transport complex protein RnfD [Bathymodiolus platifrons methanotrophic gill symbiont]|uniref:RnfABCDGE type electron transport complex subunit D n=1 Tax=Bathymodiolus platifrons methanotrophic gill symbiont TaxID=113268 RepID=UPI000B4116AB|nr:RnfABCDGE type electron transport complex subunit D [Bathymodiolus platifrons methanotrophic gill symbiont]MCK5870983.1 RnfABCDGE type electron transport complex subunit D [Methyloprofundus sp.]TXK96548.1 electron transporter RnfD [Methylococcaceae bacterium CS4]TXK98928.1 electron transporter RnfD [Methylococcaceae bacterium CS5]TXL06827.1 electron transporter RnfD [Methylococcaceae bacterium CS3]TXL07581.1 electron transporter RnfD [Methylococcaceae bacterium CS1]TXL11422.1 electron tran
MAKHDLKIDIRTSPYIRKAPTVAQIMRNVVYALLPLVFYSVYHFGISALALILITTLSCIATEQFFCWMSHKKSTINDFSAVITGLLLAMTLPPGFPLWMGAVAGFTAIAMGKTLFGGLGFNVFNPALVGRAFIQAAFPVSITTWTPALATDRFVEFIPSTLALPFMKPLPTAEWSVQVAIDGFTGATPLALMKFQGIITDSYDLFLGNTAGSTGETSTLLILVCGAYLVYKKMLDWRIPAAVIIGTVISAELFYFIDPAKYPSPAFMLLSGGLMFAAVFMASDMVASPVTPLGIFVFGCLVGFLTVIIRLFGGLTEAVMYAILFGNAATPIIETYTQPRIYGARKKPQDKS